jgi:hypothetical protein
MVKLLTKKPVSHPHRHPSARAAATRATPLILPDPILVRAEANLATSMPKNLRDHQIRVRIACPLIARVPWELTAGRMDITDFTRTDHDVLAQLERGEVVAVVVVLQIPVCGDAELQKGVHADHAPDARRSVEWTAPGPVRGAETGRILLRRGEDGVEDLLVGHTGRWVGGSAEQVVQGLHSSIRVRRRDTRRSITFRRNEARRVLFTGAVGEEVFPADSAKPVLRTRDFSIHAKYSKRVLYLLEEPSLSSVRRLRRLSLWDFHGERRQDNCEVILTQVLRRKQLLQSP